MNAGRTLGVLLMMSLVVDTKCGLSRQQQQQQQQQQKQEQDHKHEQYNNNNNNNNNNNRLRRIIAVISAGTMYYNSCRFAPKTGRIFPVSTLLILRVLSY